jgi:hypothetical protein
VANPYEEESAKIMMEIETSHHMRKRAGGNTTHEPTIQESFLTRTDTKMREEQDPI